MKKIITILFLSSLTYASTEFLEDEFPVKEKENIMLHYGRLDCTQLGMCSIAPRDRRCKTKNCLKRAVRQDEMGPFWANRGKKDPTYVQSRFFVEEPRWILMRHDDDVQLDSEVYDPFFTTRGKKEYKPNDTKNVKMSGENAFRNRRDHQKLELFDGSPFLAARGKKSDDDD